MALPAQAATTALGFQKGQSKSLQTQLLEMTAKAQRAKRAIADASPLVRSLLAVPACQSPAERQKLALQVACALGLVKQPGRLDPAPTNVLPQPSVAALWQEPSVMPLLPSEPSAAPAGPAHAVSQPPRHKFVEVSSQAAVPGERPQAEVSIFRSSMTQYSIKTKLLVSSQD